MNKSNENISDLLKHIEVSRIVHSMQTKKIEEKLNEIFKWMHESKDGELQNNQFKNCKSDLPLKNEVDLNRFEQNLLSVNFKEQLVYIFIFSGVIVFIYTLKI